MDSLKTLYRIGVGPSSSHTMAPTRAANLFLKKHPEAAKYRVILFGSLAATGKGHLTDKAIEEAFIPRPLEIVWRKQEELPLHPNGLVQIPCIERNAHAATRALSCCHFALLSDGEHKISFDDVVAVMKETGQALPPMYRETSDGGLAKVYRGWQD